MAYETRVKDGLEVEEIFFYGDRCINTILSMNYFKSLKLLNSHFKYIMIKL